MKLFGKFNVDTVDMTTFEVYRSPFSIPIFDVGTRAERGRYVDCMAAQ